MRHKLVLILVVFVSLPGLLACSDDDDDDLGDTDTQTGGDTDADTDTDTDTDVDSGVESADNKYQWHTFHGGGESDYGHSIAVDGDGNIFVTGDSGFWVGPGSSYALHDHSGDDGDIFVFKLNADGEYQWHTFYGSYCDDYYDIPGLPCVDDDSSSITVDADENVILTGFTSAAWKGPSGQDPLNDYPGDAAGIFNSSVLILKLDSDGAYQWHTYYGGDDQDYGRSLAVDHVGNILVTGYSCASWDGPDGQPPLNPFFEDQTHDFFILKLTSNGEYIWHTFYGTSDFDDSNSLVIDEDGNAYVVGWSNFQWDGPDGQLPLHGLSAYNDIFILKLDSSGAYQWHTFYPGSSLGLNIDYSAGNLFLTGSSGESWDGPDGQSPLHEHFGDHDIVILKLGSNGEYQWHTFFGSGDRDWGASVAADGMGGVFITGASAPWNGVDNQDPVNPHSGDEFDIFAIKLDSNGEYLWHTFYGDNYYDPDNDYEGDRGRSLVVDGSGKIFIVGDSGTSWKGPDGQLALDGHSFYQDVVVIKLTDW
jgi:hypothetical protein